MNGLEQEKAIEHSITSKENKITSLRKQIQTLEKEIQDDVLLLKQTKEKNRDEKEISFFKTLLGVTEYDPTIADWYKRISLMNIVFNKRGEFVKIVNRQEEMNNFDEFENWLRKEKFYAQCLSSFRGRHYEWYDWTLAEQLKNLGWEFTASGNLKNVNW